VQVHLAEQDWEREADRDLEGQEEQEVELEGQQQEEGEDAGWGRQRDVHKQDSRQLGGGEGAF
jgi:hypothetical protein